MKLKLSLSLAKTRKNFSIWETRTTTKTEKGLQKRQGYDGQQRHDGHQGHDGQQGQQRLQGGKRITLTTRQTRPGSKVISLDLH